MGLRPGPSHVLEMCSSVQISPLCVFKCLLKSLACHIGCIFFTFLHCAFLNVPSNCLYLKMHSYIGCICLTFLHCVFSNVSSNCLPEWIQSHIDCICLTFLHYVFSNASSNGLHEKMQSPIGCICLTNVTSNVVHKMCAFKRVLKLTSREEA